MVIASGCYVLQQLHRLPLLLYAGPSSSLLNAAVALHHRHVYRHVASPSIAATCWLKQLLTVSFGRLRGALGW
jgi:hypothetical protein